MTFFLGGNYNDKKISWVKWKNVLLPFDAGGLNIGFLLYKNLALLGKWRWRFHTEPQSLWAKVIMSLYGPNGGFDVESSHRLFSSYTTWKEIVFVGKYLDNMGIPFSSSFVKIVGNGSSVSFWEDKWIGDGKLKDTFNRLYQLEAIKTASVQERVSRRGPEVTGQWNWVRPPSG
ncbi:uncharacterized mitochondrial protein AtMg00310-like [Rutidosis leptorrhynchoides]|uniref:uncharacterized mitochondrial protein AtMg00310-like n=1 Tax=Rutidosis leptorrhynchoides TaxID=125765 RepID=UPI003A9A4D76